MPPVIIQISKSALGTWVLMFGYPGILISKASSVEVLSTSTCINMKMSNVNYHSDFCTDGKICLSNLILRSELLILTILVVKSVVS